MQTIKNWLTLLTHSIARYELLGLAAIAPLMLFPNRFTPLAIIALAIFWFARWRTYGYVTRPSLMLIPVVALVAMAIIGYSVSVDRALSEPKLWGIILQAAVFFAALNGLHSWRDVRLLALAIVVLTLGVAVVSLLGTNWDVVRLVQLSQIYDRLPSLIRNVPDSGLSPTQDLFHPREVGATMGMLLPFVTAALFASDSWWARLLAGITLLAGLMILLLSQALMGLAGLLAGWLLLLVWWKRWLLVPVAVALLAAVVLVWQANVMQYVPQLLSFEDPIGLGVALRLDMWSRAIAMIGDMPYTGVGLNTYPLIQTHFYTGYALGPEPHAHNLFLQTAVDLGIPGLLTLLWLLVAFGLTVVRALKISDSRKIQIMLVGLAASVVAYAVGGLLDVMTLGAKPVVALFLMLGMAGAIDWLLTADRETEPNASLQNRKLFVYGAPLLVVISVVAIMGALRPSAFSTNLALVNAYNTIFDFRLSGRTPSEDSSGMAVLGLEEALRADPQNPELYGALGSLKAWRDDPEGAVVALRKRVSLDSQDPLNRYAPFIAWQRQLQGDGSSLAADDLRAVYRQWQARFPERAEGHMLMALVSDELESDQASAQKTVQTGLDMGAQPLSLLAFYLQSIELGQGQTLSPP